VDTPLTSFTPLFINRAIIGLSGKALSFYFSFVLGASCSSNPGIASQSAWLCSLIPRCPRHGFPDVSPFAFFAWLAHVPCKLAERILSSLSADKRSPEGLGLERMRGVSYACNVPAKQKRVLNLSGTRDKL
jgi:hypothetical protein